jgi:hypothetical protein
LASYATLWPATGIFWNQIEGSDQIEHVRFKGVQGIVSYE